MKELEGTNRLIRHLLPQRRNILRLNRLLQQLRQILNSLLQISLIILEQLLLIILREVIRHRVRPLERRATPNNFIHRPPQKLDLDPRQRRTSLNLLHLLLRLRVQFHRQLRRLLVVCPAIIVL